MQQQTVYTSETSDAIDGDDLNADTWECFVSPYDGTNVVHLQRQKCNGWKWM